MGELGASNNGGSVARRRFLMRAAGGVSAALVVPSILSVTPASADDLRSPPPTSVEPAGKEKGAAGPRVAGTSTGQLAFTGSNIDEEVTAALAAISGGAALLYWSAAESAGPSPASSDETLE